MLMLYTEQAAKLKAAKEEELSILDSNEGPEPSEAAVSSLRESLLALKHSGLSPALLLSSRPIHSNEYLKDPRRLYKTRSLSLQRSWEREVRGRCTKACTRETKWLSRCLRV